MSGRVKIPLTQIITAQSAQDTAGAYSTASDYDAGKVQEGTFYIVFGAGTGSGVVKIETAHDKNYSGTWATLATVTWGAANSVQSVSVTQVFQALRARISTVIGGGTVDVYYVGAQ